MSNSDLKKLITKIINSYFTHYDPNLPFSPNLNTNVSTCKVWFRIEKFVPKLELLPLFRSVCNVCYRFLVQILLLFLSVTFCSVFRSTGLPVCSALLSLVPFEGALLVPNFNANVPFVPICKGLLRF